MLCIEFSQCPAFRQTYKLSVVLQPIRFREISENTKYRLEMPVKQPPNRGELGEEGRTPGQHQTLQGFGRSRPVRLADFDGSWRVGEMKESIGLVPAACYAKECTHETNEREELE